MSRSTSSLPQSASTSPTRTGHLADVVPMGSSVPEAPSGKTGISKPGAKAKSFEDSIQAALGSAAESAGSTSSTGTRGRDESGSNARGQGARSSSAGTGNSPRGSATEGRRGIASPDSTRGATRGASTDNTASNPGSTAGEDSLWTNSSDSSEGLSADSAEQAEPTGSEGRGDEAPAGSLNVERGLQWMTWAALSQPVAPPPAPVQPSGSSETGPTTVDAVAGSDSSSSKAALDSPRDGLHPGKEGHAEAASLLGSDLGKVSGGIFQWAPSARWSGQVWERLGLGSSGQGNTAEVMSETPSVNALDAKAPTTGTILPGSSTWLSGSAETAGQTTPLPASADPRMSGVGVRPGGQVEEGVLAELEGAKSPDPQGQGLVRTGSVISVDAGLAEAKRAAVAEEGLSPEATGTSGAEQGGIMRSVVSKRGETSRVPGGVSRLNGTGGMSGMPGWSEASASVSGVETEGSKEISAANRPRGDGLGDGSGQREKAAVEGMMGATAGAALAAGNTAGVEEASDDMAASRASALETAFVGEVGPRLMELRQQTPNLMTLVLRPDQQTELFVELRHRDGQVEIQVRVERGDTAAVRASWDHLKTTFSSQGITLHPLMEGGSVGGLAQGLAEGAGMVNRQAEALAGARLSGTSVDGLGMAAALDPRAALSATLGASSTGSGADDSSSFRREQGSESREGQGGEQGWAGDWSGGRDQEPGQRQGQPNAPGTELPVWAEVLRKGGRGSGREQESAGPGGGVLSRGASGQTEAWDAWA